MEKVGEVTNFSPKGMRILVMLLLDTLPMLGNVLLLCFFVFFIFGIIGVQLWEGILRQRCVLQLPDAVMKVRLSFQSLKTVNLKSLYEPTKK